MGILNVTPDSFFDGGQFNQLDNALKRALQMQAQGADVIDIGGESTRPGAKSVLLEEELQRVIPVIEKIRQNSDIAISIDTSKPQVMQAAIEAGASMVNDVNALHAEGAVEICAKYQISVCLMHKQGKPQNMQDKPQYKNVVDEIQQYLENRTAICIEAGIPAEKICVDPGFGFGKTLKNNLSLLQEMQQFCSMDYPVLVGISRKSMFAALLDRSVEQRLTASTSAVVIAYQKGARFFRVHDVAETCDALKLCAAVT
ncbi:Dihydropteroate synthase [hydrothermal vent metagenome]|uniref:dihydropteroate synthase n=1 Tax=hydrothermal vent metagenome TaxID=652676 RepID=A0A3B0WPI7_9ZZZZ